MKSWVSELLSTSCLLNGAPLPWQVTELHKHVQAKEDALVMTEDQNSQKSSNMVKEHQQLINQVSCTSIHRMLDTADVYGDPTSCGMEKQT